MAYETRYPAGSSHVRLLFTVAAAAILGSACGQDGARVATDTAKASTATLVDTSQSFYPEKNADSTQALVADDRWDNTTNRKWEGDLQCGDRSTCGGETSVRFVILPHKAAHTFDHERILNGQAPHQFIAKIKNLENFPYGPWGIGARDSAYLYVGTRSTGDRRMSIHGIRGNRLATAQTVTICNLVDTHPYPRVEVYRPWHCKGKADMRPIYGPPYPASETSAAALNPSIVRFASTSSASATMNALTGLWISCSGGCCEGSAFQ